MAQDQSEISTKLADLYSRCHEDFQRLMNEARAEETDEGDFVSSCDALCDHLVNLQRTWSLAHRARRNSD